MKASSRIDPYRNFRFRVKWDGRYVAGVSGVSGLTGSSSTGRTKYEAITLQRGVTNDPDFEHWMSGESRNNQKDLTIDLSDEAGRVVDSFKLRRVWVSKVEGPDFDAKSNSVTIETITLEHEGCKRHKP